MKNWFSIQNVSPAQEKNWTSIQTTKPCPGIWAWGKSSWRLCRFAFNLNAAGLKVRNSRAPAANHVKAMVLGHQLSGAWNFFGQSQAPREKLCWSGGLSDAKKSRIKAVCHSLGYCNHQLACPGLWAWETSSCIKIPRTANHVKAMVCWEQLSGDWDCFGCCLHIHSRITTLFQSFLSSNLPPACPRIWAWEMSSCIKIPWWR